MCAPVPFAPLSFVRPVLVTVVLTGLKSGSSAPSLSTSSRRRSDPPLVVGFVLLRLRTKRYAAVSAGGVDQ